MKKTLICLAVAGIWLIAAAFPALASSDDDDHDYTITEANWADSDEEVTAEWDDAADETRYVVTLYYRASTSKKWSKVTAKTTGSDYYNFGAQVIDKGTGYYYFTVYPKKGDKEDDLVTSSVLRVSSTLLSNVKSNYSDSDNESSLDYDDTKRSYKGSESGSGTASGPGGGPGASSPVSEASSAPAGVSGSDIPVDVDARGYKTYTGRSSADDYSGWRETEEGWVWETLSGTLISNAWLSDMGQRYAFGEDGLMYTGWHWITDADSVTRCYYLRPAEEDGCPAGSMCAGTIIDGYTLDADGAWTVDGVVQTK